MRITKKHYAFVLAMVCSGLCPAIMAADTSKGEAVVKGSDCLSCHAVDHKLVGPSFQDISKKYASQQPQIVDTLEKKVKAGGSGNWGQVPMTPHPQLSDADITAAVQYVLAQTGGGAAKPAAAAAAGASHSYKGADGKPITTDFAVFADDKGPKVSDDVFKGYEAYNSYCFRCHGGDAVGGEIGPDLRNTLKMGMDWNTFLATVMAGRQDKGMPAWAGFFEEKDLRQIYDYIKARQLELVPAGRPASAQD